MKSVHAKICGLNDAVSVQTAIDGGGHSPCHNGSGRDIIINHQFILIFKDQSLQIAGYMS